MSHAIEYDIFWKAPSFKVFHKQRISYPRRFIAFVTVLWICLMQTAFPGDTALTWEYYTGAGACH
jgi:hypothetical protein